MKLSHPKGGNPTPIRKTLSSTIPNFTSTCQFLTQGDLPHSCIYSGPQGYYIHKRHCIQWSPSSDGITHCTSSHILHVVSRKLLRVCPHITPLLGTLALSSPPPVLVSLATLVDLRLGLCLPWLSLEFLRTSHKLHGLPFSTISATNQSVAPGVTVLAPVASFTSGFHLFSSVGPHASLLPCF